MKDAEDLMEEAHNVLIDLMDRLQDQHVSDWTRIKNEVKGTLSDFVWKETQRRPMILPVIEEV